jgi:hypothetical protein
MASSVLLVAAGDVDDTGRVVSQLRIETDGTVKLEGRKRRR